MDTKRKLLNLQEKIDLIKMVTEKKMSIKEAIVHFKCGKTQIYDVIKHKDKIMHNYLESNRSDLTRKKNRDAKYSELNRIVFKWYSAARAKNFPISGPIILEKAKEISGILNLKNFAASNGWLESFRRRHSIIFNISRGEMNESNRNEVDTWHVKLQDIIRNYDPMDIANADETALFFRALPDKTLQVKGEKCSQGGFAKERLTVLLIVFADGVMENPLVIGKSENPQCFKSLKKCQLPVEWKANKNAWMTNEIFEEFLSKFNKRMEKENRNILLFLDNATCHLTSAKLSNIKLIFLPPSTTSVLQPLGNGIIQAVKLNYRYMMLQNLISKKGECNSVTDFGVKINVLDAVMFLSHSVNSVQNECVKMCFRNCGFIFQHDIDCGKNVYRNDYAEIQNLMEEMHKDEACSVNVEDFVNMDENVITEIDEIHVQNIIEIETNTNEDREVITREQAVKCIDDLKYYMKMKGENVLFNKIVDIEIAFNQKKKQSK